MRHDVIPNGDCKYHVCSSREVAEAVKLDLDGRGFGPCSIERAKVDEVALDLGGAVMGSWEHARVDRVVNGASQPFFFYPHQVDGIIGSLRRAVAKPREGGYVKAHGRYNCLCLDAVDARGLLDKIVADLPKFKKLEVEALGQWDRAMDGMRADQAAGGSKNVVLPAKIDPAKAN